MNNTQSKDPVPKEPDRRARPRPTSGATPPPHDGDDAGAVDYGRFFGEPMLDDDAGNDPGDVWGDPEGEPVTIPSLRFTAYPPEKELYRAAFKAAYRYPDALMLVMQGVRKGLKRGKEAAQAGGQDR